METPAPPQLFPTDKEVDDHLHQEQLRKLIRDGFLEPIPEHDVREATRFRAVYFGPEDVGTFRFHGNMQPAVRRGERILFDPLEEP